MKEKKVSLPVGTEDLSHASSIAPSLFLDTGEPLIIADLSWGNYNLIFPDQRQSQSVNLSLFVDQKLNGEGLDRTIDALKDEHIALIFHFPNNPAGYTPMVDMSIKKADAGKNLHIFTDDACFGLFFEDTVCKESPFGLLCDAHESIFSINGDAATNEEMVWGLCIGFLAMRGTAFSWLEPAQSILIKRMHSHSYEKENATIAMRYRILKEKLVSYADHPYPITLPFNSGYLMAFQCAGDAEQSHLHLVHTYGVKTISVQNICLRLAFLSTDIEQIEDLVALVYQGAQEVFGKRSMAVKDQFILLLFATLSYPYRGEK